ncbi:MAG TPA: zinc-ribbon domain containing protein [Syntrophales bacterium]|nr:zinc-ribbon domain containing protein [Syntrophales bacterium]HPQ44823.1 zinc-ribbon domain containing protein [Syntrophales bacterium]
MEDIRIGCIQCGREFVFTAAEQRQYKKRNFSNPRRCPECRKKKAKMNGTDENSKSRNKKDTEMYW